MRGIQQLIHRQKSRLDTAQAAGVDTSVEARWQDIRAHTHKKTVTHHTCRFSQERYKVMAELLTL
jgi:hypothetical protein